MNRFKKLTVILLSIPLMMGCAESSESNTTPITEEQPKIALTLNNYTDYIACYTEVVVYSNSSVTYWNFYGSPICKFYDPTIHYERNGTSGTFKLTISGCGQMSASSSSRYGGSSTTITNVTGYVQVLY